MRLFYVRSEMRFSLTEEAESLCLENISDDLSAILVARTWACVEQVIDPIDDLFVELFGTEPPQPNEFTKLAVDFMVKAGCDSVDKFVEMTWLDKTFHSHIVNYYKRTWTRNTVFSLIAGFKLNHIDASRLLNAAGIRLCLQSSYVDRVYSYAMYYLQGRPIEDWSAFFVRHGLLALGSKKRKMKV